MKVPSTKPSREFARRQLLAFAGAGLVSACGGGSSSLGVGDRATGGRKVLFVLVDGLGPDYLRLSDTPNLDRMIREGDYREGPGVIPSVTNVNNASVATGASRTSTASPATTTLTAPGTKACSWRLRTSCCGRRF